MIFQFQEERNYYILEIGTEGGTHKYRYWNMDEATEDRNSLMIDIEDHLEYSIDETAFEKEWK